MAVEHLIPKLRRNFHNCLISIRHGLTKPSAAIQPCAFQSCALEAEYVQKIRKLVEKHLDEAAFTVSALCHQCHTSQPQLYRKLTALTGLPPVRFIRNVRFRKAKELLRHTELTISEIAYETGFNSPAYFTRLFVKTEGITPSEYRKTAQKA